MLSACPGDEPVAGSRFLSAGGNGFFHALDGESELLRVGSEAAGPASSSLELVDPKHESLFWSSSWDMEHPWCALTGAKQHLDWAKLQEEGTVRPKPTLRCIDAKGQALAPVELPLAFNRANIDPTGRYVVLYSSDSRDSDGRIQRIYFGDTLHEPGELFNRNLSVVVDLSNASSRSLVLDGFGDRMDRVVFPSLPEGQSDVDVDGVARNLAIYSGEKEMIVVDLNATQLSQVAVRLRQGAPADQRVFKVRPGDDKIKAPTLFVADGARDIEQIRLKANAQKPGALDADYSILTSSLGAKDLEFVTLDDKAYAVAATSNGLLLTDLKSEAQLQISQAGPLSQLLLHEAQDGTKMLLGWENGGRQVMKISLQDLSSSLGRRPKIYSLDEPIYSVRQTAHQKLMVQGPSTLTFIDLEQDKQTPMAGLGESGQVVYPGQDYVYVLGEVRQTERASYTFGRIDLRNLVPETQTLSTEEMGPAKLVVLNNNQLVGIHVYGYQRRVGLGVVNAQSPTLEPMNMEWFND